MTKHVTVLMGGWSAEREISMGDLKGMTVGIIDNHKRNVDVYVAELGRVLQDEYGVAKVVTYRKASQSIPTPSDVLDSLAAECDAIVHAVAD